jgi:hypothetical protein
MEHAVIVHIPLTGGTFGSAAERQSIARLERDLEAAIDQAEAGELDGDEFGEGECVLFMYGPDADRLFGSVEPLLRRDSLGARGYAIKRYGEAADPEAREEIVRLR